MGFGDLGPGPRSPADVAEHFWIGIELDLQIEMAVGKRDQEESGGPQNGLRHLAMIASHWGGPADGVPARSAICACVANHRRPCPAIAVITLSSMDTR